MTTKWKAIVEDDRAFHEEHSGKCFKVASSVLDVQSGDVGMDIGKGNEGNVVEEILGEVREGTKSVANKVKAPEDGPAPGTSGPINALLRRGRWGEANVTKCSANR